MLLDTPDLPYSGYSEENSESKFLSFPHLLVLVHLLLLPNDWHHRNSPFHWVLKRAELSREAIHFSFHMDHSITLSWSLGFIQLIYWGSDPRRARKEVGEPEQGTWRSYWSYYGCITNYPKPQWLRTMVQFILLTNLQLGFSVDGSHLLYLASAGAVQ